MSRKMMFSLAILVMFSLVMAPFNSVQAQGPLPPRIPFPTTIPHYPPQGNSGNYGDIGKDMLPQGGTDVTQNEVTAAVALGEPGLSYRYVKTVGTTGEPYLADGSHLNSPNGLFIDSSNNLYTVEENGYRMLKFNASGVNTLTIGHAGYPWHHDDFLASPKDVAVDLSGNIWVVISPAIKEFDSAGNLIRIFPETNPWESGTANDRFNDPRGIAFDSTGKMYISDGNNHRIQVYDVSGGAPTYLETIGETGVSHNDNAGFNQPAQIAFDSLGRLYVVDLANYRVQRCTKTTGWTCETFFGVTGEPGSDLSHMGWSYGITIKNDTIYIAEGDNYRVLKCDTNGTCSHFAGVTGTAGSANNQFAWPADVAVDSTGNVYVSDFNNHRIQKFNSSGTYLKTIGVTKVPYLTNVNHINAPWGVAVNATGDIFVAENRGYRLLKYNAAGSQTWTIGTPGIFGYDNAHFGQVWAGLEGNPAIDGNGRIYVTDTSNNRVQIFNPNASYYGTLGTGWGTGNYEFNCPAGVAISPVNGDVYVNDHCNQRIQVFTSGLVYKATLGETGVEGNDNQHFRWPWGVAVANNGDIFVADSDNHRVQKCSFTSGVNYTCSTFAGETGIAPDGTFNHIHPLSVAVDSSERVFVADEWDGRVMVYDSAGAFLTSIGDNSLSGPSGVAVDPAGNVYVGDRDNHRIQKYSPDVPGWGQVNINGFGDRYNRGITALEVFGGTLYAGASNWEVGGSIWRSADAHVWTRVTEPGFGNTYGNANPAIIDMIEFNNQLYASVGWDGSTGQLWRSSDGTTWEKVVGDGFGDANNGAISSMAVYNNMLYVGTGNSNAGAQIWRSSSGNVSSWENVVTGGLGCTGCGQVTGLIVFNNVLYAAIGGQSDPLVGMQIWNTNNGSNWTQVGETGFGSAENYGVGGFAIFNGNLYVGTQNAATGGQIWRSSDGSMWTQVNGNGFGDINNIAFETLYTFGGNLYAGAVNGTTGFELWSSANGVTWSQINLDGFGDVNNDSSLWSHAITDFSNSLYIGTWNWNGNGGEIWNLLRPVVMTVNTILDTGDGVLSEGEQVVVPVTQFAVTFNKDINPPAAANFTLKNGTTVVPVNNVLYDAGTKTSTIKVNGGAKLPTGSYTLTVKGAVTATDGNSMMYDFVRHFAVPAPLTVPTLLLPANNSVVTDYTPRLDWSTTTLAPGVSFDHYRLRVASDSGFHSIILDQNITGLANSEFTFPSDLNPNSTFYWYVQAYSTVGQVSGWSPIWSFHTALLPVTLNPLQNGDTLRPTFSWIDPNIAPLPTSYSIQIAAVSNFSTLLISGTTSTPSYTPSINLPAGKTLYWRVRANGGNGPSLWATGSFTSPTPPSTTTLLLPANNSLNTNYTPALKWSAVTSVVPFAHYQVQVDDDPLFGSTEVNDVTHTLASQTTLTTPALAHNTKFYWRVLAFNTSGQYSISAVWSFRTALTPPTLVSPDNGFNAPTLRPTFDWEDVNETGVTGYTIQISTSSSFAIITNTGSPLASTYTPLVDLPKNKLLYWRVQTRGANGPSAWSAEVRSFTSANAPTTPVLVAPILNALNTNYTPLFKWNAVTMPLLTDFKYYQLQVDDNLDFSSPVINDTSITNRLTTQFQVGTPLAHNTRFYWRVRAVNTDDEVSNWSAVWYFRTALTPPTLVSPVTGYAALTLRPTFDWGDVIETGGTGYTIQISATSGFTTIANTSNPVASDYTPAVDLPKNLTLYWRVQTRGTNGPSAWSEVRSFTSSNAPSTPVLSLPALNALITDDTPLLKWSPVTMPLGTTFKCYQLQVDDISDFSSPVIDDTSITNRLTTQFQVVTPLAHNTKFFWRVRAVNTDNEVSNWSTVWFFRVAVDTTTLLAPANGTTVGTLKPVFDWEDVNEVGVTGYTIQVATSSTFGTLLVNSTTVDSTYTRLTNLPAGKTLYWRVRVNGVNGPSVWTTPAFSFNTSAYHEAPGLPDTLPPVEKRLPDTPVVTTADYAVIGKYGGTIQTASWWPEVGNVQLYFAAEAPIKWNARLTGYEPGLAESYDWSVDGKTFTLHLRKGLKWSDGVPYTSADWKYWWEDYALNPNQQTWTIPAYLRNADGTPINMTFPDAYTVVWTSKDRALYLDPYFMAQGYWEFARNIMKPAHYLKQFNPKYYPTKTWENYAKIDQWWANPKFPCLFAWCLSALSSDGQNYTFSRNPYYWRVDADGNQLPYIDKIKVEIVSDEQTRILNCALGKYDTAFRICGNQNEISFLAGNAATGGYHLLENYMNGAGAWPGYMVNQDYVEGGNNYADDTPEHAAEIRNLLRNHDFRVALSTGFNRQAVINAAWGGVGEAKNATISPQSLHFLDPAGQAIFQQWAASYTTFNATAANALLDGLGMTKGIDGWRRLPSGKPFTLIMDISDWGGSLQVQVDAADEMKKQWETNLGIQVQINNLQGAPDLDTRTNEGYYMIRAAHVSELDVLTYPDWVFPVVNRYMFPLEGRWFAMGGDACTEQPTEGNMYPCGMKPENGSPAQILQGLYNQARGTSTFEGRNAVVQNAAQEIIEDGPFIIGVSGDRPMPIIVKNYMRNILDYGVVGPWAPATPGNQITALWWMDK